MPPLATLDEPLFNPSVFGLFETQRRFLGICFSHFAAENKIIPDSSTAKRRPIIGSDVISDPVEEEEGGGGGKDRNQEKVLRRYIKARRPAWAPLIA